MMRMTACLLYVCMIADDDDAQANIRLAKSLFRYLATLDPQPDFILYTGDDPAHG